MGSSVLYCEIYAFALALIIMVIVWNHRAADKSLSGLWFTRSLYSFAIAYAFEFLWGLADGGYLFPKSAPFIWSYFFKIAYFCCFFVALFIWTIYTETEQGSDLFLSKDRFRFLLLPVVLEIFLAVLTPWTKLLFSIDSSGTLHYGLTFQLHVGLALLYPVIAGIRTLTRLQFESNQQRRGQLFLIGSFMLYLVAAWGITFAYPNSSVYSIAITCAVIAIDLGNSTEQISLDKLTQINNRQNLLGYIAHAIKMHEQPLYLLMMDVDYFKKVNDNFGHQEGDAALVRVANALKTACGSAKKRPYLARYGGDEFIIVTEAADDGEIQKLCDEIHKQLQYYNSWSEVDYDLTMSIGVTCWKEGMDTKALIDAADQQLYEAKKTRHPFTIHPHKVPRGVNMES